MSAPVFILAQIGGEVPVSRDEFGLIAFGVAVVFAIGCTALVTWATVRRRPPIERQIDQQIDEKLAKFDESWRARHKELHDEMLRLNQERRVTVAGLFEKIENYRKETKDDNGALTTSVQKGFNDLHGNMGKIEGMLSVLVPKAS